MLFLLIKYKWPISYLLIIKFIVLFVCFHWQSFLGIVQFFQDHLRNICQRDRSSHRGGNFRGDALFQSRWTRCQGNTRRFTCKLQLVVRGRGFPIARAPRTGPNAAETSFRKLQCIRSAKFPALCARESN